MANTYFHTCPICGANNDPGEICECMKAAAADEVESKSDNRTADGHENQLTAESIITLNADKVKALCAEVVMSADDILLWYKLEAGKMQEPQIAELAKEIRSRAGESWDISTKAAQTAHTIREAYLYGFVGGLWLYSQQVNNLYNELLQYRQ